MSNTYFLSTLLPSFSLTEPHTMSMEDLEYALEQNLTKKEQAIVSQIWLLGDVENVCSYLRNETMTKKGTLEPDEILAIFALDEKAPFWLEQYLKDFPSEQERKANRGLLSRYCLKYTVEASLHPAIYTLFAFEYTTRCILEQLRKKEDQRSSTIETEKAQDLFEQASGEYQELISLWNKWKEAPRELEHEVAEWKFSYLNTKRETSPPFSMSRLIFSVALFDFIEGRRALQDENQKEPQERIIQAICHDNY